MSWIATPSGLYRYDAEGELFIPEIFPEYPHLSPVEISSDGEQLWVIADSIAGYIDLYTGGRYTYSQKDGLPPGKFTCIAYERDYIWIGSKRGVSRFDRFIEQWEYFSLKTDNLPPGSDKIRRIEIVGDYLYFAAEAGIIRFDSRTETFALFDEDDGIRAAPFHDLKRIGEELWCFGQKGVDIFSISQGSWSFLGTEHGFRNTEWRDIEDIGGDLYFLSDAGIDICEISTRRIYPFLREDRLDGYHVHDMTGSLESIWFATDRGLLRHEIENPQSGQAETWVLFDRKRGAVEEAFFRIGSLDGNILGLGDMGLDVIDTSNELFLTPLVFRDGVGETTKTQTQPKIRWDDEGLRVLPTSSYRAGLSGSYSYLLKTDQDQSVDRHWGRLQPYLRHESGRSLSGLYDNTDPDETLYGATYRGIDGDLLRRMEGGNRLQFKQTHDLFFGGTTLRGGTALLEAGERRGKKGRSLLRSTLTFGEKVTRSAKEFFNGSQGRRFVLQHQNLLIGSAEVILNGRELSEDEYTLVHTTGTLLLTFIGWELLNEGDIIEILYQYRLTEEEINETIAAGELVISSGDALQVTISGFEKSSGSTVSDSSFGAIEDDGFRAAQVSSELRGTVLGGEGRLLTGLSAGERDADNEIAQGCYLEGDFNRGAWTINGKWSATSDSLPMLEDRSTEFGYLRGENELGIRYEPGGKLWLEGKTTERKGSVGEERNYHFGGQFSPISGTSAFGAFDYFDADTDNWNRQRWIGLVGLETVFSQGLLDALKLNSSRLRFLGRTSEVRLDSSDNTAGEEVNLRTNSLLTRLSIVPGTKLSLFPELRWSSSERAVGDGEYQPDSKELAPRMIFYTRDLIEGITSYFDGEACYSQAAFDTENNSRDVELFRQGTAQIDLSPGVYLALLNPVSLRINMVRNAEDSLLQIGDDYSLFDLGFSWKDYPSNMNSYRYDSDAIQITWAPHYAWLFYQSISEVRTTSMPTEQVYSTRVEWKPGSMDQVFWKYTLNKTLESTGNEYQHRPGIEWYRRWSSRTFTSAQFNAALSDMSSSDRVELTPGVYLDQRFQLPGISGSGTLRIDFSTTYYEQTIPYNDKRLMAGGYSRVDFNFWQKLLLRFRTDRDYVYSYTDSAGEWVWSAELRVSARF